MTTDRTRWHLRTTPRHLALLILAFACGSKETHVGCSPTLTCSLDAARFEPPSDPDAGPPPCHEKEHICRAEKIAAGGAHTCAIAPAGELLCWGDGREGQRGTGLVHLGPDADGGVLDAGPGTHGEDAWARALEPVVEHAREVAAGDAHSCAIDARRDVLCWGRNAEGQVDGVASSAPAPSPVAVGVKGATGIAAGGAHSCAITARGVECWGSARRGQVGRSVEDTALPPGLVVGTASAVEVSAGVRHTCARLEDGRVLCWGEQLAVDGELRAGAEPRAVEGLDDAAAIAAGAGFSCALRQGGSVVCWGLNDAGQLGDGTQRASARPVEVTGLELSLRIAAGGGERDGHLVGHACAMTKSFFVQCWGRNREGQLGVGMAPDASRAAVVLGLPGEEDDEPFLPDVIAIAVGGFHTCAIDHDGPVICWGDDSSWQLDKIPAAEHAFGRPAEASLFSGSR